MKKIGLLSAWVAMSLVGGLLIAAYTGNRPEATPAEVKKLSDEFVKNLSGHFYR